jgi:hypothetical protein
LVQLDKFRKEMSAAASVYKGHNYLAPLARSMGPVLHSLLSWEMSRHSIGDELIKKNCHFIPILFNHSSIVSCLGTLHLLLGVVGRE